MPVRCVALIVIVMLALQSQVEAHGDIHLAIAEVTRQLATDPDNPELYFQRGQFYRQDGDFAHAKADFLKARQLEPDLVAADLELANLHLEHNQLDSAYRYIQRFMLAAPDHVSGRFTRSLILIAMDRTPEAMNDIATGIEMLREPRPAHFLLAARTTLLIDSSRIDEAFGWLEYGEEILGPSIVLTEKHIELATLTGAFDRALARIDQVLLDFPRAEKWEFKKADILEQMGAFDRARAHYERCLEAIRQLPPRHRYTRAMTGLAAAALSGRDRMAARTTGKH